MTATPANQEVSLGMPQLPAPDYPADVRARLDADAKEVVARYPDSRSALLPLLHLVQSQEGYVTRTGVRFCAETLGLTTAEVTAVSTFYSMYRRKPGGDYQVGVCTNTLCAVMGGDAIFDELKQHLGVGNNETTEDGKVTLEHIECNAACDFAPVVMVNWEFFDDQTPESAKRLVDDLRAGRPVRPTRGAPLCTYKETARILAGFPDERPGAVEATGGAGPASLIGLRLAKGETPQHRVVHPRAETPQDGPPHDPSPSEHLSSNDAPQQTSASDPAHPAGPAAEEGE
nr:NADH-quinone oxidoreductase subunit NuoE [Streptomyces albidochromogenes]